MSGGHRERSQTRAEQNNPSLPYNAAFTHVLNLALLDD